MKNVFLVRADKYMLPLKERFMPNKNYLEVMLLFEMLFKAGGWFSSMIHQLTMTRLKCCIWKKSSELPLGFMILWKIIIFNI